MIRLFATIPLAIGLLLMPLSMMGQSASANDPAVASMASCPGHSHPTSLDTSTRNGMVHCLMCAALLQPDQALVPPRAALTRRDICLPVRRLESCASGVSDPPPKIAWVFH
ncbi:MAG: hypothetical protein V4647_03015 [Pseudomonadota bacterium]